MSTADDKKPLNVSRNELADMMLITPRQVHNLWKEGHLSKESKGMYDLRKVIPEWTRYKNAQIETQKHGDISAAQADKMLTIFSMELKRLELAVKQKKVMNLDDLERMLMPAFIATRKKLDVLGKQLQSTFPKDEPPEVRKAREDKIQKIIDDISTEMANIETKFTQPKAVQPKKKKSKK